MFDIIQSIFLLPILLAINVIIAFILFFSFKRKILKIFIVILLIINIIVLLYFKKPLYTLYSDVISIFIFIIVLFIEYVLDKQVDIFLYTKDFSIKKEEEKKMKKKNIQKNDILNGITNLNMDRNKEIEKLKKRQNRNRTYYLIKFKINKIKSVLSYKINKIYESFYIKIYSNIYIKQSLITINNIYNIFIIGIVCSNIYLVYIIINFFTSNNTYYILYN